MKLNNAMQLEGKFKIAIENAETGEKRELDWQDNVILNQILSSAVDKVGTVNYLLFGTGTTTPNINQTSLATPLTVNHYIRTANYGTGGKINCVRVGNLHRKEMTIKFIGTQGQVVGNVSELGISTSTLQTGLCTRALIKDGNGNPTTITLGVNDILTVWYTVTMIIDCSVDVLATKTFQFNGQTIAATLRLINQDTGATATDELGLTTYSLLTTGQNNNVQALIKDLFNPSFIYATIASGTISNLRNINISTLTQISNRYLSLQYSQINGAGVAYTIGNSTSYKEFAAGTATGTWKYIFFNTHTTNPVASQTEMNRCNLMLEFTPPLVKAAADKFTFDTFRFIYGGVPA